MNTLKTCITTLESKIEKQAVVNKVVSEASVGWHIEHSLLVINQIIGVLKVSDAGLYKWKFNFTRAIVLATKRFPRGRVRAPKSVTPTTDFNAETLQSYVKKTLIKIEDLNDLEPNKNFNHPIFGNLNKKQAIKFLSIHTKHHLHIIDDILRKK
jgi:hypothetical protein